MNKIYANSTFEDSLERNYCRWSHGKGIYECQCGLEFGHAGKCKCFDPTCNQEWSRPRL